MKIKRKLILRFLVVLLLFGLCFWKGNELRQAFAPSDPGKVRFILDAGHGGEDGGAVSLTGIKESTLNLEIALKTEQIMGFLGEAPMLLRRGDKSLHEDGAVTLREKKVSDLKNRVRCAEQHPAATLVSIHQNSYPEPEYRGTQVFFAPTDGSSELAQLIQRAMVFSLQPENTRQEKPVPDSVYLMNHIQNRAILIECGFLTNPEEEALLRQGEYQKKLAMVLGTTLVRSDG